MNLLQGFIIHPFDVHAGGVFHLDQLADQMMGLLERHLILHQIISQVCRIQGFVVKVLPYPLFFQLKMIQQGRQNLQAFLDNTE